MEQLEYYYRFYGRYPSPGYTGDTKVIPALMQCAERLNPIDGFGHPLIYSCSNDGQVYLLCSTGKDGKLEQPIELASLKFRMIDVPDANSDMIVSNGEFYHWLSYGTDGGHLARRHELFMNEHKIINASTNANLLLERAKLLIRIGCGDAAEELLQKVQNLTPDDPEPSYILADHYMDASVNNFQKAIEALNKCIQLEPTNEMFWSRRGWAYLYLRSFQEATVEFRQAIALSPSIKNQEKQKVWDFLSFLEHSQKQKTDFMRAAGFQP